MRLKIKQKKYTFFAPGIVAETTARAGFAWARSCSGKPARAPKQTSEHSFLSSENQKLETEDFKLRAEHSIFIIIMAELIILKLVILQKWLVLPLFLIRYNCHLSFSQSNKN